MTIFSAPGKLFIAGEYAVVEPGEPAIIVAVNRCITVETSIATGSGQVQSALYNAPIAWTVDADGTLLISSSGEKPPGRDLVTETMQVLIDLARNRDIEPFPLTLTIQSELFDEDGVKFGLGSSAAVTVAIVEALSESWGMHLTVTERVKAALISTLRFSPRASGGDIAASTLGGWIRYTSPDRDWIMQQVVQHGVAHAVGAEWPHFELRNLPSPSGVQLAVGWTGSPADTDSLVTRLHATPQEHADFLAASRIAVNALTEALCTDNTQDVLSAVSASQEALAAYDSATGHSIETQQLTRLRQAAEASGAVAKVSGAGGGDCGIVLSKRHTKLHTMFNQWRSDGIIHLPLDVFSRRIPL